MLGRRRGIQVKTPEQILVMRAAGLVVHAALTEVVAAAKPGVTTAALDALAHTVIRDAGATPSFLGYYDYPATLCISVNDEIVHGIPGQRVLAEGDVVGIDCGAIVDGWHGDSAVTVSVGMVSASGVALIEVTRQAMWRGLAMAKAGNRIGDISATVQAHVQAAGPYGLVTEYVGHGIGTEMHQEPSVPNLGRAGKGPKLEVGMCIAIEPMVTLGSAANHVLEDEWTVVTDDGSPAAHWEHTVAITANGPWVLTAADGGAAELTALGVATPAAGQR